MNPHNDGSYEYNYYYSLLLLLVTSADSPHFDKSENLFIVPHLTIQFSARWSVTESVCVPAAVINQLRE